MYLMRIKIKNHKYFFSFNEIQNLSIIRRSFFESYSFWFQILSGIKLFQVSVSNIMNDCYDPRVWMLSCVFDSSCNVQSWWTSHKDSFIFYHVICHMKCFFIFDFIGFVNHSNIKVICGTIKSYSLNDSIERIFKSISFFLLIGVENTIFNFVKKSTSLWVRKNDINFRIFLFQILGDSCYWSTCTSSANESIK